jgi:hypothetical protein
MKLHAALDAMDEDDARRWQFLKLLADTRRGCEPTLKEKKMIEEVTVKKLNDELDTIQRLASAYKAIPDTKMVALRASLESVFVHETLSRMASKVPVSIRCNEGRYACVQRYGDQNEIAGYGDTLAEAVMRWLIVRSERVNAAIYELKDQE